MATYSEKLKDPRWQKKRLEIFEMDKWYCQSCLSKDKTLHVHHIDYLPGREPWEYDDKYLMTLCADCHADYTENTPALEKKLISRLRLILKSPLLYQFTIDMLEEYDESLLYLLFECKERKDDVINYLRETFMEITDKYSEIAKESTNA